MIFAPEIRFIKTGIKFASLTSVSKKMMEKHHNCYENKCWQRVNKLERTLHINLYNSCNFIFYNFFYCKSEIYSSKTLEMMENCQKTK